MYKLVALDLDGTLLNPEKNVSDYNKKVINALIDQDVNVVIATGRTFTAAYHYYLELGLKTPVISCNGGFIYDPKKDTIIHGQAIDAESLEKIIALLDELGVYYQYYTAKTIYTKQIAYLTKEWLEQNQTLPDHAKINIEVVANPMNEIKKRKEPIYKVLVTDERDEIRQMIWERLAQNENLELVVSIGMSVDIMAKGITKGNALAKLASHMHIPIGETLAMGDNHNDLSMIQTAGCGIAMENAEEAIRGAADRIAASNKEDGVGRMLNTIFELSIEPEQNN